MQPGCVKFGRGSNLGFSDEQAIWGSLEWSDVDQYGTNSMGLVCFHGARDLFVHRAGKRECLQIRAKASLRKRMKKKATIFR